MNTFYIARHGETENNKVGRLSGWIDTPLTEHGLEPTKIALKKLELVPVVDAIYSSDLGRAFTTAYEIASGLNLLATQRIIRLAGLREVNYGNNIANMERTKAYEQYPLLDRDTYYVPPEGESLDHMQTRVIETLTEIDAQHDSATILIVAHSGVMAALNARYKHIDLGHHNFNDGYPHDYVARFTIKDATVASFDEVIYTTDISISQGRQP